MSIPCANQPLIVDFYGGFEVNYNMPFNQDTKTFLTTQSNFPIDKLGVAINTSDLSLAVEEKIEKLIPPITVPVACNPTGSILVSDVTVNTVSVEGPIQFVANANLFADNTISIPNGVKLAWPSCSGNIYINKTLLAYTDNVTDKYSLEVKLSSLKLHSATKEDGLYFFVIAGELSIQANKI